MWYTLEVMKKNILVTVPELGITESIIDNYSQVETTELRTLAL